MAALLVTLIAGLVLPALIWIAVIETARLLVSRR